MDPILILTGIELEARRLARDLDLPRLRAFPFPVFGRGPVRLAPVGIRAALGALRWDLLLAGLDRPLVVSAGLCGGLDRRLRPGDLILPARVMREWGGEQAVDSRFHRAAVARAGDAVCTAPLVTTREVAATPGEKAALFAATGAAAVDMESALIVERATNAGLPALVVRAVSDGAEQPLPAALTRLVTADGRLRLARAMALTVARPGMVTIALGVRRRTHRALDAVARALSALIG